MGRLARIIDLVIQLFLHVTRNFLAQQELVDVGFADVKMRVFLHHIDQKRNQVDHRHLDVELIRQTILGSKLINQL